MSFKKLKASLLKALENKEITTPNTFQTLAIPKIKSGANVFGIAPKGAGKTTTLIINTLQKLNCAPINDAPRAMIFVKDKNAAIELADAFESYAKGMKLRIYMAYDERNIDMQKDDIYQGTDILIGTPKRLSKLFLINAIDVSELKLFIVEDAEFLIKGAAYNDLLRIPESLKRCQYLIFASSFHKKLEQLEGDFMSHATTITL